MAASLDSSRRSRRRRSLTSRMSTSAPVTAPLSSSGMQRITTAMSLPSPISSVDRQPGLVGERHRRLVEPGLVEADPFDAGVDAHAVEGVDGVRRGVVDPGAGVEDQHAVADPGVSAGDHLVDGKGKLPLGDHAGQAVEDLDVDPLELARAGGRPTSADSRVSRATSWPCQRTGMQTSRACSLRLGMTTSPSTTLPELPGPGQQGPVLGVR